MKWCAVTDSMVPTLGELLDQRRLPLDAVALLAEVHPSAVSRWRSGESRPQATSLIRLAQGLGISVTRMRKIVDRTVEAAQQRGQDPAR
jgi:transcriptional regulator with XRE-family HTH domain